jgi:chemotaxis protein CheD
MKSSRPQPQSDPRGEHVSTLPGFERVNRYWDRYHNLCAAKILPGEYYVTGENEVIVTVLGSCVSACVRDPITGIGGMNHFMLPMSGGSGTDTWVGTAISATARYGNIAMEHLITSIMKFGGARDRLEVKIFGGGNILSSITGVGQRNIEFIRRYIEAEGLPLLAADLGDVYPRKVYYFPATGKVRVKKLRELHNNTIVDRETAYMKDLDIKPVEGEITLF